MADSARRVLAAPRRDDVLRLDEGVGRELVGGDVVSEGAHEVKVSAERLGPRVASEPEVGHVVEVDAPRARISAELVEDLAATDA